VLIEILQEGIVVRLSWTTWSVRQYRGIRESTHQHLADTDASLHFAAERADERQRLSHREVGVSILPASAHELGFSQPPDLPDLSELTLDDVDLDAIRTCHPGDCNLKLGAHEIERLRSVVVSTRERSENSSISRRDAGVPSP
jgi:hypothetical protein